MFPAFLGRLRPRPTRTEQREIFNLLTSAGAEYSKNVNGCFFDITAVPDAVIERIEGFIRFCCDSNLILDAAYPKLAAVATPTTPERTAAGVTAAEAKEAREAEHAVHTVLQETLAKARAEALASRRRETSRYLQLRKRFSRASAKAQNYPDVLQYE